MNSTNSKKLFIIAGEPSADLHGSNLIKSILEKYPDTQFIGMGGELMKSAGAKLYYDIGKISVIGFVEVIKKLPLYRKIFKNLRAKLDTEKPDAVILIDYPGFNINFAKEAKKRNLAVIYYISPQIWAWHKSRIKTIKKVVDKMLVLFEFEKDLYKQYSIDAVFTGHPLVDVVKTTMPKQDAIKHFGFKPNRKIIALLPGSRKTEVKKVLPIMLKSVEIIAKKLPETQFMLIKSPIIDKKFYEGFVGAYCNTPLQLSVKIIDDNRYDAVACADFALVASGTATLETAILGIPMALVYKVSFLTWLIARILIRIPYIGLVNVIAAEKIIPEFIQFGADPEKITTECITMLQSPINISKMKTALANVKEKLGPSGASANAANEILNFLNTYNTNPKTIR